jgi:signal transduction histidine kinase
MTKNRIETEDGEDNVQQVPIVQGWESSGHAAELPPQENFEADFREQRITALELELANLRGRIYSPEKELKNSESPTHSSNEALLALNHELKNRVEHLSAAYEYSQAILANRHDATMILDRDLRVCHTNNDFHELFETVPQDVHGRILCELDGWDIEGLDQKISLVTSDGHAVEKLEIKAKFKTAGEKNLLLNINKYEQHGRWLIVVVIEEPTGHSKDNETPVAPGGIKQYIRDRREFLRAATHDLRGSFGILIGATGLLGKLDTHEERSKTMAILHTNLNNVSDMLNQLLDYSRLEAGEDILEISDFNVADVLNDLCESSIPVAREKGLTFQYEGPNVLKVKCDVVKVRRVAQNLILNALKYTLNGGIMVSWGIENHAEQSWYLQVSDTGPGISERLVADLLDKPLPRRNEKSDQITSAPGGEGIGLFIVKRLLELLLGQLKITSKKGEGTLIHVSFARL